MLLLSAAALTRSHTGDVKINGDLAVAGDLSVSRIESGALTVNGSISVAKTLRTTLLRASSAQVTLLETDSLASPTGQLKVEGELSMANANGGAPSFLEAQSVQAQQLVQHGMRQWALVHHEDFEAAGHGWHDAASGSFIETSAGAGNAFLGGHCKTAAATARRRFSSLPEHTHLRVQARVHFIDAWAGESAFLQVDGRPEWLETADSASGAGLNVVGGPHPERRFGVPVDVTLAHTGASALIEFGSSLEQHACDASFGVDDVHVLVR
jgi:hypothetical protein